MSNHHRAPNKPATRLVHARIMAAIIAKARKKVSRQETGDRKQGISELAD
jgi:hypothetical protein